MTRLTCVLREWFTVHCLIIFLLYSGIVIANYSLVELALFSCLACFSEFYLLFIGSSMGFSPGFYLESSGTGCNAKRGSLRPCLLRCNVRVYTPRGSRQKPGSRISGNI